jgi:hypothetical protein
VVDRDYLPAAIAKTALFFAIWLSFFSAERLPNSMLVANFKNPEVGSGFEPL